MALDDVVQAECAAGCGHQLYSDRGPLECPCHWVLGRAAWVAVALRSRGGGAGEPQVECSRQWRGCWLGRGQGQFQRADHRDAIIVLIWNCLGLTASEQSVVLLVWADPEPDDVILFHHAESAVSGTDAHGVDRISSAHALEIQAWMTRVRFKQRVSISCLPLDVCR